MNLEKQHQSYCAFLNIKWDERERERERKKYEKYIAIFSCFEEFWLGLIGIPVDSSLFEEFLFKYM